MAKVTPLRDRNKSAEQAASEGTSPPAPARTRPPKQTVYFNDDEDMELLRVVNQYLAMEKDERMLSGAGSGRTRGFSELAKLALRREMARRGLMEFNEDDES